MEAGRILDNIHGKISRAV